MDSEWLLFGNGPMLRGGIDLSSVSDQEIAMEHFERTQRLQNGMAQVMRYMDELVKSGKAQQIVDGNEVRYETTLEGSSARVR